MNSIERLQLLVDYLDTYMRDTGITANDLAKSTNITHATLSRLLNGKYTRLPDGDSLIKLAQGTGTDIRTLGAVIAPDLVKGVNPKLIIMTEEFSRLTEDERQLVQIFIAGIAAQKDRKNT